MKKNVLMFSNFYFFLPEAIKLLIITEEINDGKDVLSRPENEKNFWIFARFLFVS